MIVSDLYKGGNRRFTILSECDKPTIASIVEYFSKMSNKNVDPELLEEKIKKKFKVSIKILKIY